MKTLARILKEKFTYQISLILLFLTQANLVFAQSSGGDAGFGAVGEGDMSKQFLGQIFGGLVGGGVDAFGASIATFNSAVLIVGGILVAYTILAGTLGTAHDGEMLGKKFSSVWVPIRTVLGTALVLPVYSGGYCTMQAIVMWLILQGVSLANMVWSSYIGNASQTSLAPKLYGNNKAQIKNFVDNTYAIQACLATYDQAEKDSSSFVNIVTAKGVWDLYDGYTDGQSNGNEPKFLLAGNSKALGSDRRVCGTLTYPVVKFDSKLNPSGNTGGTSGTSGGATGTLTSLSNLKNRFVTVNTKPIYEAILSQTDNVVKNTRPIANTAITSTDNGAAAQSSLNGMISGYESAVLGAANGVLNEGTKQMAESAKSEGWFTAGTFATRAILIQNAVQATINNTGVAEPRQMTLSPGMGYNKAKFNEYSRNSRGWMDGWGVKDTAAENSSNSDKNNLGVQDPGNADGKFIKWVISSLSSVELDKLASDTRHPILIAQQMGESLIKAITSIILLVTGAGAVGAIFGYGGVASAILTGFAIPIAGFYGAGFMLAYAVPNMPLFLWIGIIIGWSVMVVEAIIAAPLWAVMHLHPSGDDMTGKGGSGYMLVLGLTVRPALIIFGLIAAIVLSDLFGQFLNAIFLSSFVAPQGIWMFVNIVMLALMYSILMMQVINSTFSLMHKIPDQLLRWIGGGSEQLGQYAGEISNTGMQKFVAGAGAIMGKSMETASQGGQLGIAKLKEAHAGRVEAAKQEKNETEEADRISSESEATMGVGSKPIMESINSLGKASAQYNPESKGKNNGFNDTAGRAALMEYQSDNSALSNDLDKQNYNTAYMDALNSNGGIHSEAAKSARSAVVSDLYGETGASAFNQSGQSLKSFNQQISTYKEFASGKGISEGGFNSYMNESGYQVMTNDKLSTGEKNQIIMDGLSAIGQNSVSGNGITGEKPGGIYPER